MESVAPLLLKRNCCIVSSGRRSDVRMVYMKPDRVDLQVLELYVKLSSDCLICWIHGFIMTPLEILVSRLL